MTKIPLTDGVYTSKSLIANAQRCVNLFPEIDPNDSPFPTTHYLTPGLTKLATVPVAGPSRLDWVASNGQYFRVVGSTVYAVSPTWVHTAIGSISSASTPCSMADNGLVAILVDGSTSGYVIDLSDNAFSLIYNPLFYGADRVRYLDTYFIFDRPGTNQWYLSLSEPGYADLSTPTVINGTITGGSGGVNGTYTNVPFTGGSGSGAIASSVIVSGGSVTAITLPVPFPGQDYAATDVLTINPALIGGVTGFEYSLTTAGAFNSLDIAAAVTISGDIVAIELAHKNVWLLKSYGGEVWFDAGNTDFAFSQVPGAQIEHGCAAKYSVCSYDGSVFWLGRDRAGTAIVFQGTTSYQAERISTHCIENILNGLPDITDAVGGIYQGDGHTFYMLSFPTADQTWCYDLATKLWHERVWTDDDGQEHRHRMQSFACVGNQIVGGDWETGDLYLLDLNAFTDNGQPIVRRRGFPHIVEDGARIQYRQLILSMDVGITPGIMTDQEPQISLRWSDTAGNSYGQPISTGMGASGQYLRSIQFQRLGMGRDRVFEVFWSAPISTALNGAFCDFTRLRT
jgi:hypothetical protein